MKKVVLPAMRNIILRCKHICIYLCLVVMMLTGAGCTSKNTIDYARIDKFKGQVVSFVEKEVNPRFQYALEVMNKHLAKIYDRTGAVLSDIVGDPAEQKKSYAALADRCPEAIAPIDEASARTGISPNYLLILAYQESSCNARAKASTSSAAGMFQFVEHTWLISVKKYGSKYGYRKYADGIATSGSDGVRVTNSALRQETLDLRYDPNLSATLAAELALENERYLKRKLSRRLSATDLYLAHFLGAYGASKFLVALEDNPRTKGVVLFPAAARSNRTVFYSRNGGGARSLADIYSFFEEKINISS